MENKFTLKISFVTNIYIINSKPVRNISSSIRCKIVPIDYKMILNCGACIYICMNICILGIHTNLSSICFRNACLISYVLWMCMEICDFLVKMEINVNRQHLFFIHTFYSIYFTDCKTFKT